MALTRRELDRLIREQVRFENGLGRRVREILDQARTDILTELGSRPSEWRAQYLRQLLNRVDERIQRLRTNIVYLVDTAVIQGATAGMELGLSALPAGTPTMMTGIDPELLRTLADYRADLITGVTDATRDRITEIIRRSMLSGRNLLDVERELGNALPGRGAFRSLAMRTETIVRTEYGRILEMNHQAALERAAQHVPGLQKKWICTFRNSRDPHMAAHGQTVPVDQPFIVNGERLMYPKGPAGSAGNVCNCRCRSVPVVPEPETEMVNVR